MYLLDDERYRLRSLVYDAVTTTKAIFAGRYYERSRQL